MESNMEISKDMKSFIKIISSDAEVLYNYLKDEHSLSYELSREDITLFIDFNLFIDLVKISCFKNKTEIIKIPVSLVQKDQKQKYIELEYVPVPEKRKRLFMNIFMPNFKEGEIITISRFSKSTSTMLDVEDFYYRFFYAFFNIYLKEKNKDALLLLKDLYKDWEEAIENNIMHVRIWFDLEGFKLKDIEVYSFDNKFNVEMLEIFYITKSTEGRVLISSSPPYITLSLSTSLKVKVKLSKSGGDSTYQTELKDYREGYRTQLRDLYLFVCSFYLNNFEFLWKQPKIELPWYFEPKEYQEINERYYEIPQYLSKKDFNDITDIYIKICNSNINEQEEILLDSFFRTYQHKDINVYFIFDIFAFFESLFTRGNTEYIKLRLRLNGASFLTNEFSAFWDAFNFFGILYDIRSLAVHGAKWYKKFEKYIRNSDSTNSNNQFTKKVKELRDKILKYMNNGLSFIIEQRIANPNFSKELNDDALYFFHKSKFFEQTDNKEKIINKLKQRYEREKIKYKDKWEEIVDKLKL
ncbi:MAG: hypothetical protein ACFFAN_09870 [Promethearchaeota archaeon]